MQNENEAQTATEENTAPTTEGQEAADAANPVSPEPTAPAPNAAQQRAQEILAARGAGKPATEAKAPKAPKEPGEPKAPKAEGLVKTGYRFLRDIDPAVDKLNKQQTILIDTMLGLRKSEGDLKDIVLREELLANLSMEKLASRQPPERVFGFYLNGWKKDIAATEKKPAIPALFEVIKITFKS